MADKAAALGCSSYWKHWDKPLKAEIPMAAKCSFPDLALWELCLLSVPWMCSGDTVEASLMCFVLFFTLWKPFIVEGPWLNIPQVSAEETITVFSLAKAILLGLLYFFSTLLPICLFFCRLIPPPPRYVTEHSRAANSFWWCFALQSFSCTRCNSCFLGYCMQFCDLKQNKKQLHNTNRHFSTFDTRFFSSQLLLLRCRVTTALLIPLD